MGREHSMGIWVDENPEKLTVVKTKILAKRDDNHFTALSEIGAITANLALEKSSGMASAANVNIGPIEMKLERVYVSGGF